MMKSYCYACDKDVSINIKEAQIKTKLKNIDISFLGKIACCNECGEEIYLASIRDENVHNANYEYRKASGIITTEEIQEIFNKYNIGKKPLAELLGWGEMTIVRYGQGLMPTHEYSQRLKELFNPHKMKELYEKNKDKLSQVTQKKLEDSINSYLNTNSKNNEIDYLNIANYFLSKIDVDTGECITPLKIQKLVYNSQAWSLAINNETLFEQDFQAWLHGPVLPELYFYFKNNSYEGNVALPKVNNFNDELLELKKKQILEMVWNVYGKYDGKHLEKISHQEEPWITFWEKRESDTKGTAVIKKNVIKKFYFNLKEQLGFDLDNTVNLNKYAAMI